MSRWLSFLLATCCAIALLAGALVRLPQARAEAASGVRGRPSGAPLGLSSPRISGLAPLPGGARVPESDRPPGAFADDGGPSPVIFPAQRLTLRFNHRKHVKELKLSCTTCHSNARTSRDSSDSLLPSATRCDGCHGSDHRDLQEVVSDGSELIGQCGFCHLNYRPEQKNRVERLSIPRPNLRFNHAAHHQRKIGCQQCHGMIENIELATRDQLPRMRGCFNCHQMPGPARGAAKSACTTCHLTKRGSMKTEFASGRLTPPRWLHDAGHDADWIERHKTVAGNESQFCSNCHREEYCVACHDGRVRPRRIHPNDWLSMHPVAARQNSPTCTSCHQEQSFCVGCHQRAGVALTGPYANFAGRGRFHPPKSLWTDAPRRSGHHAWEAERNLNACVSCHVERDCTMCHATASVGGRGAGNTFGGGQGVNPHPAGFGNRCAGALHKNARPCLVCHDPLDPKLQTCR